MEEKKNCQCENKESKECTCEDCECDDSHGEELPKGKNKHKKEKVDELKNKIKELEEKSLRDQADLINYRKRKDEEVSRLLKYSNEDIISDLLPIIDSFESAIKMDDTNLTDEVSRFMEGFKLIYCNILNVLEKHEIKPIDGIHKPFDPTYHQAVLTEKVDGIESDQVIEVLQRGYILKDRVIRPAMVKVSE